MDKEVKKNLETLFNKGGKYTIEGNYSFDKIYKVLNTNNDAIQALVDARTAEKIEGQEPMEVFQLLGDFVENYKRKTEQSTPDLMAYGHGTTVKRSSIIDKYKVVYKYLIGKDAPASYKYKSLETE
ncbi:hypothetical protein [Mycoplasma struthionis]|nr:hypothetical protein [Mycoplasma struthionis]TPI02483.1 hypothetical protein FJM01_00660 [Mycoplasma struthionis]